MGFCAGFPSIAARFPTDCTPRTGYGPRHIQMLTIDCKRPAPNHVQLSVGRKCFCRNERVYGRFCRIPLPGCQGAKCPAPALEMACSRLTCLTGRRELRRGIQSAERGRFSCASQAFRRMTQRERLPRPLTRRSRQDRRSLTREWHDRCSFFLTQVSPLRGGGRSRSSGRTLACRRARTEMPEESHGKRQYRGEEG